MILLYCPLIKYQDIEMLKHPFQNSEISTAATFPRYCNRIQTLACIQYLGIYHVFSRNSETFTSDSCRTGCNVLFDNYKVLKFKPVPELLENLEYMFTRYNMDGDKTRTMFRTVQRDERTQLKSVLIIFAT